MSETVQETKERLRVASGAPNPLLIVGSVAIDNIVTPIAEGTRILGGSASYGSIAASYFAPVRLVGIVGNDFEDSYVERLRRHDIDLAGLQHDESGPTLFWSGRYHENFTSRDTEAIELNVFEHFRPELPDRYDESGFVLLGNIGPDLQAHVLEEVKGSPFVVADTIDLWIKTQRDELLSVMERTDLFVINDDEAEIITEEANVIKAGWKLLDMGPRAAIVKKGPHGALLFHPDGLFALPAFPVVDLHDPTGAGDAFAGALLGYLAATGKTNFADIKQAMVYGTATASLTIESFGCDRLESAGNAAIEERAGALRKLIAL